MVYLSLIQIGHLERYKVPTKHVRMKEYGICCV